MQQGQGELSINYIAKDLQIAGIPLRIITVSNCVSLEWSILRVTNTVGLLLLKVFGTESQESNIVKSLRCN